MGSGGETLCSPPRAGTEQTSPTAFATWGSQGQPYTVDY